MVRRRPELVDLVAARGIGDPRVLRAIRDVPRSGFVPAQLADRAADDVPVPIGHDQVTTQPSLAALMVEALELEGDEGVLEVGGGYGYQTALLAKLSRFVWSVEWWADLADKARANLAAAEISNVEVVTGDGSCGLVEHAPFDCIVVAAAFPTVPPPLVQQLAPGGRLVQPLGRGGDEDVVVFVEHEGGLRRTRSLTLAHFVRLVGVHGFPPERTDD